MNLNSLLLLMSVTLIDHRGNLLSTLLLLLEDMNYFCICLCLGSEKLEINEGRFASEGFAGLMG